MNHGKNKEEKWWGEEKKVRRRKESDGEKKRRQTKNKSNSGSDEAKTNEKNGRTKKNEIGIRGKTKKVVGKNCVKPFHRGTQATTKNTRRTVSSTPCINCINRIYETNYCCFKKATLRMYLCHCVRCKESEKKCFRLIGDPTETFLPEIKTRKIVKQKQTQDEKDTLLYRLGSHHRCEKKRTKANVKPVSVTSTSPVKDPTEESKATTKVWTTDVVSSDVEGENQRRRRRGQTIEEEGPQDLSVFGAGERDELRKEAELNVIVDN